MGVTFDPQKFGERLKKAAMRAGISNPPELSEFLRKKKHPVKEGTIRNHWYSLSEPPASTVVVYAEALGVSLDWLLTGEEPPPPSIAELIEIVNKSAIAHGHPIKPLDVLTEEIVNYLLTADEAKRKLLVDLVRNLKGKE